MKSQHDICQQNIDNLCVSLEMEGVRAMRKSKNITAYEKQRRFREFISELACGIACVLLLWGVIIWAITVSTPRDKYEATKWTSYQAEMQK